MSNFNRRRTRFVALMSRKKLVKRSIGSSRITNVKVRPLRNRSVIANRLLNAKLLPNLHRRFPSDPYLTKRAMVLLGVPSRVRTLLVKREARLFRGTFHHILRNLIEYVTPNRMGLVRDNPLTNTLSLVSRPFFDFAWVRLSNSFLG